MIKILSLDPSGSFKTGKGTTGFCVVDENGKLLIYGSVSAKDYTSRMAYWAAHPLLINEIEPDEVVMESFVLYGSKAKAQTNSDMETSQLIGIITDHCMERDTPLHLQTAAQVKRRWADHILIRNGKLEEKNGRYYVDGQKVNRHIKDAMRHAFHYVQYTRKKRVSK